MYIHMYVLVSGSDRPVWLLDESWTKVIAEKWSGKTERESSREAIEESVISKKVAEKGYLTNIY